LGDRLVRLARVYVPAHVAVVGGKTIHVAAYTRTVKPGFRSSVEAGGGGTYGEGGLGPSRRIEVTADEDNMGRPKVSGPVLTWTQDDGEVFERGRAYQWDMGGVTYTGTFSGIHGGGPGVANDRAIMRDVEATYPEGATKTHEQFYAPRSGVRSLEDVDKEVREAAMKQGISPIEYLRSKLSRVELAQVRVGKYLRKGESGKIESVEAYVRYMNERYGGIPPGAMSPKAFEKELAKTKGEGKVKVDARGRWKTHVRNPVTKDTPHFRSETPPKPKTTKTVVVPETLTGMERRRPKRPPSGFLGHDANGNEIKEGSPVLVTAGPDKGIRGTVRGIAKGGGVRVEVAGNLGKTREVLVDPDELRVKSR
jgi:hypothetical protein